MHDYPRAWARCMLAGDSRVVGTQIIANLMSSASFRSSTSTSIIAGLGPAEDPTSATGSGH